MDIHGSESDPKLKKAKATRSRNGIFVLLTFEIDIFVKAVKLARNAKSRSILFNILADI